MGKNSGSLVFFRIEVVVRMCGFHAFLRLTHRLAVVLPGCRGAWFFVLGFLIIGFLDPTSVPRVLLFWFVSKTDFFHCEKNRLKFDWFGTFCAARSLMFFP